MKEQKENTGSRTIALEKKVQANIRQNGSQLLDIPLATGYTVDDKGIINNYAILPDPWQIIPQQNSSNVIYS